MYSMILKTDFVKIVQYIKDHIDDFSEEFQFAIKLFRDSHNIVVEGLNHTDKEIDFFCELVNKFDIIASKHELTQTEYAVLVEYMRSVFYFSVLVRNIPRDKLIILLGKNVDDILGKEGKKNEHEE